MLADLLAEAPPGHLGDQERRYSEGMREVAQDIQSLVGDMAELARLMAGRVQIRPEKVVLERLVDQVEEAVRPRARAAESSNESVKTSTSHRKLLSATIILNKSRRDGRSP